MDVSNINSFALSFLTLALAVYTALLWSEAKKTRIQNLIPQISLSFYPWNGTCLGLMIINTGNVDAVDVKIECLNIGSYKDKNREYKYAEKLSKEYSYLPVNQVYKYFIGYYTSIENECFRFKISACDMSTKYKIEQTVSVCMDQLQGILIDRDHNKQIAESLKSIDDKLSAVIVSGGNGAIRCHTYSQQYREDKTISQKIDDTQWILNDIGKAVNELKNKA